jgi:peptidoglycan pentaglycine glycine transferase (the first glycine)
MRVRRTGSCMRSNQFWNGVVGEYRTAADWSWESASVDACSSDIMVRSLATSIDDEWDAFVAGQPDGHHEQSSGYGANRRNYGFEVDRVLVREHGSIVGGAQLLVRGTAVGRVAHVQRAPLARNGDVRIMQRVVDYMIELARERHYFCLRVDTFPGQPAAVQALDAGGFEPSALSTDRWRSLVIPLADSDDELLGKMHYNVRRYVRKLNRRNDISIRHGDLESLDHFFELHEMSSAHQHFKIFPLEYFRYLWRLFGEQGRTQHFVAYQGGSPVAGIVNTVVNGTMYYGWGGIHRGSEQRRLHANLLLHLEAIRWARDAGCHVYDLCGTQRFKRQLGLAEVCWPMPRFRFFGAAIAARRRIQDFSRSPTRFARAVRRLGHRFGINPPMPY